MSRSKDKKTKNREKKKSQEAGSNGQQKKFLWAGREMDSESERKRDGINYDFV